MRLKPQHYPMLFLSVVIAILAAGQRPTSEDHAPRGAYIVYTSVGFNGIYITRPDGTDARTIEMPTNYVWTADCDYAAQKLVFASGSSLYTLNFDGSSLMQLPVPGDATARNIYHVAFAPDGQRLSYTNQMRVSGSQATENQLILADPRTQQHLILLHSPDIKYADPRWSRDGKSIAYSFATGEGKAARYGIGVVGADGSANHPVLTSTTWLGNPDWSPDGRSIVVSMQQGKWMHLFSMRADGTELTQLTRGDHYNIRPRWSPDGRWISFSSNRYGQKGYQIFLMDAETKAVQQVNDSGGDNYNQCWM